MLRTFVSSIFFVFAVFCSHRNAVAASAPAQSDICTAVPTPDRQVVVSKSRVASFLLTGNTYAVTRVFDDPSQKYLIFTTTQDTYCPKALVCPVGTTKEDCDKQMKICVDARFNALNAASYFFDALKVDAKSKNRSFRVSPALAASQAPEQSYFATSADDPEFLCLAPPRGPKDPAVAGGSEDKSPWRVRGGADDLNIDRSVPQFKAASQATLTFSGDHSTVQTQNAKIKGAVGYAIEPDAFTSIVPYVSFYQSVTDVKGKAQSIDPSSNVAGGVLFSKTFDGDVFIPTLAIKPQYMANTEDNSKIESLRVLFTPTTDFDVRNGGINLNNFRQTSAVPFTSYTQLQFDIRSDIGRYTDRGNDPVQRLLNNDYGRVGSRFGVVFMTDPTAPSFTLNVAETLMYGWQGSVRNLDLFETSLTYNPDPKTNYIGLTASYRKGRDEDTALRVQTWLIGLSGKY